MNIAVYCASSNQLPAAYYEPARQLGQYFARAGHTLIYGDGGIGLMGALADGVLGAGGEVVGVIPRFMVEQGWNNPRSTRTIVTETMHERKHIIADMADAMFALPGGIGTFEELLECLTWKQLGLHTKPVVILNLNGYYDHLLACLDRMVDEHFLRPVHRERMFCVVDRPEQVLPAIADAPAWSQDIRREAAI